MRDHPVFKGPNRIDTSRLIQKPTPDAWRDTVKTKQVSVLPLVKDPNGKYDTGWISYHAHVVDSPETEIISGGLSEREIEGAALWRQGHLLHFAFDISPAEMNETGQALLLNSIAYIAQFREDRPIARTPSGWSPDDDMPRSRRWIEGLFAPDKPSDKDLAFYFTAETKAQVASMDRVSFPKWLKENLAFITCDPQGRLTVDVAAKELKLNFNKPEFFPRAIEKLNSVDTVGKAAQLLRRYAPDGPAGATAGEWKKWWQENEPYLFYTERGGYRWYIDPLGKKRGISSSKLQGPARASRE